MMQDTPTPAPTSANSTTTSATSELIFQTLGELLARVERLENEAAIRREESAS
jgi:hypothetical protein